MITYRSSRANVTVMSPLLLSLLALTTALGLSLAVGAWRRRLVPGATAFAILMAAVALWTFAYALELLSDGLADKLFWAKASYLGVVTVPIAWLAFARAYTGRAAWLSGPRLLPLILIHLVTLVLSWTNDEHGLIWSSVRLDPTNPFGALSVERGLWLWVYGPSSYLAMAGGGVLIAVAHRRTPPGIRQNGWLLLLGAATPWLSNLLHISGLSPVPGLDLTPVAFAITGLTFGWLLFRERLLDIFTGLLPVAWAAIINGMSDGVLVFDDRGRLADLNPAGRRLLSRSTAVVLGGTTDEVLADWPAALRQSDLSMVIDAELRHTETPQDHPTTRHYDLRATPLYQTSGRLAGRLIVARDVSDRKRIEEVQRFLAEASTQLASSLDVATTLSTVAHLGTASLADYCLVDLLNAEGTLERVASAHVDPDKAALVEQLTHLPTDPHRPVHRIGSVLRTGRPDLITTMTDELLAVGTSTSDQVALIRQLGPISELIVPLIARDRILGVLILVRADSGRHYQPDDVLLVEALALRAALAVDNARLYSEAQAALRLRDEFLSVASHELRTPLTTIDAYVQLLDRRVRQSGQAPERLIELTGQLRGQVDRFARLIDDLLDHTRLQGGQLSPRRTMTDLRDLVTRSIKQFEHAPDRLPQHRMILDAPEAVPAMVDPVRLDQALSNLISNAIKYSPQGGEIRVSLRRRDPFAELTITDQGMGIALKEQERIFEPFVRGTQANSSIRGSGLGLSIAAQIIRLHDGEINLQSQPGQGSSFTLRLPLALLPVEVQEA